MDQESDEMIAEVYWRATCQVLDQTNVGLGELKERLEYLAKELKQPIIDNSTETSYPGITMKKL